MSDGIVCIIVGIFELIIGIGGIASSGDDPMGVFVFCFLGVVFIISGIIQSVVDSKYDCEGISLDVLSKYLDCKKMNKTFLDLFVRPVWQESKIILANKFVIIEFNIEKAAKNEFIFNITDKINMETFVINAHHNRVYKSYRSFANILTNIIDYDTVADDIVYTLNRVNLKFTCSEKKKIKKPLYLDINKASEAELTAIPGVTIAKAKHAIKMRKKYSFYLTMNQFYETINLDEEFIEQIQTKGKKIVLNSLPEYKMLQMKKEEE